MFSRLSPSTRIVVAFASVYLFWGSTYVAIHVAGEHLPVPVVSATRSVISAVLIAVIAAVRGISLRVPKREPWKLVLIGLLIMSANNMLLTWGETMVPSGFASLIICTIPIMIGLMETVLPGGDALNGLGWAGTLIATLGIAVLVWPSLHAAHGGHDSGAASSGFSRPLAGTLAILGAALAFAVASVLSRRFQFKGGHVCSDGVAARLSRNIQRGAGAGYGRVSAGALDLAWLWVDRVSLGLRVVVRAGGVYLPAEECRRNKGGDVCVCESGDCGAAGRGATG